MLERLDHLKCAVCLEFMVAAHSVVPCGARLPFWFPYGCNVLRTT